MFIVRSVLFSLLLALPSAFGSDPPELSGNLLAEGGECHSTQRPAALTAGGMVADSTRFELYRHVHRRD